MSFKLNKFLFLFVIIIIVTIVIFDFPVSSKYEDKPFVIKRGENVFQIANNLKNDGYVKSKIFFILQSFQNKNYKQLKAGTYSFNNNLSNQEIINVLIKGEKKIDYLTIIPGNSLKEISEKISLKKFCTKQEFLNKYLYLSEKDDELLKEKFSFLKDKPKTMGLEGYFFPDTYEVDLDNGLDFLINQILTNFDEKLTAELRGEIKKQNKTVFDVIIMASVIEKEVISYEDKEIISGILWKRLSAGMPLEVDSTALYFDADKNKDVFYNTYRKSGLPVSPICSPGEESIKAAIYPKQTDYWFYLSAKNGETIFSKNFNDHLINKYKYLDN